MKEGDLCRCISNFQGTLSNELVLCKNDVVQVHEVIDKIWLYGEGGGNKGRFPSNSVVKIVFPTAPVDTNLYAVTADFKPTQNGDLPLIRGDFVTEYYAVDSDWGYGESNGSKGIFPYNFVWKIDSSFLKQEKTKVQKVGKVTKSTCGQLPDELSLYEGDTVIITELIDEDWYRGECNGQKGIFPTFFIKITNDNLTTEDMAAMNSSYLEENITSVPNCTSFGSRVDHECDNFDNKLDPTYDSSDKVALNAQLKVESTQNIAKNINEVNSNTEFKKSHKKIGQSEWSSVDKFWKIENVEDVLNDGYFKTNLPGFNSQSGNSISTAVSSNLSYSNSSLTANIDQNKCDQEYFKSSGQDKPPSLNQKFTHKSNLSNNYSHSGLAANYKTKSFSIDSSNYSSHFDVDSFDPSLSKIEEKNFSDSSGSLFKKDSKINEEILVPIDVNSEASHYFLDPKVNLSTGCLNELDREPNLRSMLSSTSEEYINEDLIDIDICNNYTEDNTGIHPYGRAVASFKAQFSNELSFTKGDIIHVLKHVDSHWTVGKLGLAKGIFPTTYIDIIVDCPYRDEDIFEKRMDVQKFKKAIVCFDFVATESTDCSAKEGDLVLITDFVSEFWVKIETLDGKSGNFPINYLNILLEKKSNRADEGIMSKRSYDRGDFNLQCDTDVDSLLSRNVASLNLSGNSIKSSENKVIFDHNLKKNEINLNSFISSASQEPNDCDNLSIPKTMSTNSNKDKTPPTIPPRKPENINKLMNRHDDIPPVSFVLSTETSNEPKIFYLKNQLSHQINQSKSNQHHTQIYENVGEFNENIPYDVLSPRREAPALDKYGSSHNKPSGNLTEFNSSSLEQKLLLESRVSSDNEMRMNSDNNSTNFDRNSVNSGEDEREIEFREQYVKIHSNSEINKDHNNEDYVKKFAASNDENSEKKFRQRKELINELVTTEHEYIHDLSSLLQVVKLGRKREDIDSVNLKVLLGNLEEVVEFSKRFLTDMSSVSYDNDEKITIGAVFVKHSKELCRVYKEYSANNSISVAPLLKKYQEGGGLPASYLNWVLTELRQHKINLLDMQAVLIKPVQRVLKYPLFIDNLIQNTPESHLDYRNLEFARNEMLNVAKEINDYTKRLSLVAKYRRSSTQHSFGEKIQRVSMHSVAKMGSRLKTKFSASIGLIHQTKDLKFEEAEATFRSMLKAASIISHNAERLLDAVKNRHRAELAMVEAIAAACLTSRSIPHLEDVRNACRETCNENIPHFESVMKRKVLSPVKKLILMCDTPERLILKRYDKLIDYDAAQHRLDKNKDPTRVRILEEELKNALSTYEGLNEQLILDLPILNENGTNIVTLALKSLITCRMNVEGKIAKIYLNLASFDEFSYMDVDENMNRFSEEFLNIMKRVKEIGFISIDFSPKSPKIRRKSSTLKLPTLGKEYRLSGGSQGSGNSLKNDKSIDINAMYPKHLIMVASKDYKAEDPFDLSLKKGTVVGVIKNKDPSGSDKRWYVDNGIAKGFVKSDCLSLINSMSGTLSLERKGHSHKYAPKRRNSKTSDISLGFKSHPTSEASKFYPNHPDPSTSKRAPPARPLAPSRGNYINEAHTPLDQAQVPLNQSQDFQPLNDLKSNLVEKGEANSILGKNKASSGAEGLEESQFPPKYEEIFPHYLNVNQDEMNNLFDDHIYQEIDSKSRYDFIYGEQEDDVDSVYPDRINNEKNVTPKIESNATLKIGSNATPENNEGSATSKNEQNATPERNENRATEMDGNRAENAAPESPENPQFFYSLYDFNGCGENQIPLRKGQVVLILIHMDNWTFVQDRNENRGYVPSSYLRKYS